MSSKPTRSVSTAGCFHGRLNDGFQYNSHLKKLEHVDADGLQQISMNDIIAFKKNNNILTVHINSQLYYKVDVSSYANVLSDNYTFFIWNGVHRTTYFTIDTILI
eukprot:CAMPEP_0116994560 /NCGR_PEP_ID=MMETSP0467-20121206/68207_1 /TAXON_ID=283647 /ORGANISM="Mesodinium pulex, Strain SPMC105" /LENGTH=104 /DNA_ID=CAMNT_0004692659 /DNA_START=340 /DNA_END=654 /DNA_ORIENTATION=+